MQLIFFGSQSCEHLGPKNWSPWWMNNPTNHVQYRRMHTARAVQGEWGISGANFVSEISRFKLVILGDTGTV